MARPSALLSPLDPETTAVHFFHSPMTTSASWTVRLALALLAMAVAADCFLKYVWWAACYSAWSGIPRLAEQCRRAGSRASLFGWSVAVLEIASIALIFGLIRMRETSPSRLLKNGLRLAAALAFTVAVSALLAGALSWIKQGTR